MASSDLAVSVGNHPSVSSSVGLRCLLVANAYAVSALLGFPNPCRHERQITTLAGEGRGLLD